VISLLLIGWGLLGAVALQEFALALLIGMISGVYSSIFIATPLLAIMRADKSDKPGRPRLTGEALRAAVIGTGASGRLSASMADELGGTAAPASRDAGDDAVLVGAEAPTTPLESASTSERLLSHPPRPRKKKRH
jgi:preprotein translocase subunit SecF